MAAKLVVEQASKKPPNRPPVAVDKALEEAADPGSKSLSSKPPTMNSAGLCRRRRWSTETPNRGKNSTLFARFREESPQERAVRGGRCTTYEGL